MLRQIVIDRGLQVIDAGIAATSDAPRRDLGEEALHEVQPRRAGGREVQLEAGVLCQPGLHVGEYSKAWGNCVLLVILAGIVDGFCTRNLPA